MKRLLIIYFACFGAFNAFAQAKLGLNDLLSPTEQALLGLNKLTEQQKQHLADKILALMTQAYKKGKTDSQVTKGEAPTAQKRKPLTSGGRVYSGTGNGHWVQENISSGDFILLEDGSLWKIDPFDTINASLWLPISNITVIQSSDGSPGYDYLLINTDDSEKAHAQYIGNR
jgi:hypothetical protein